MTALAHAVELPPAGHLLTVAEYEARGADELVRWELLEGNLVMTPRPTFDHMSAIFALAQVLDAQVPTTAKVGFEVDLDLQFEPADGPGTVRQPDLIIVDRIERNRVRREGGFVRASAAHLVVEVLSPGSRRTDRIVKVREYADAGIPNYWILALDPVPTLTVLTLESGVYVESAVVTGIHRGAPFDVTVDVSALVD